MYKIMLAIALMVGFIRLMCFLEKVGSFFKAMRLKVRPRRDFSLLQKRTPETSQFKKGYQISDKWHMEHEDIVENK